MSDDGGRGGGPLRRPLTADPSPNRGEGEVGGPSACRLALLEPIAGCSLSLPVGERAGG
jgi:hypothetical protein